MASARFRIIFWVLYALGAALFGVTLGFATDQLLSELSKHEWFNTPSFIRNLQSLTQANPIQSLALCGAIGLLAGSLLAWLFPESLPDVALIASTSIRQRRLASSLTALSIALGVALMVTVLVINAVVTRMFSQSATGYHLVVGAKGSDMQLVLNTIYFMDRPIENLPYKAYLKLKSQKWIKHAIPFNLGDTTEDGKYRIVGTIPEYFEVEYVPGKHLTLQQGAFLKQGADAVIGARVARAYGWKAGHKFPIAHGGNLGDIHDEKFTVVGVLAATGTPIDRAVFIHLDGFYSIEGHEKPIKEARAQAKAREAADGDLPIVMPAEFPGDAKSQSADQPKKERIVTDEQKEVTAILVLAQTDSLAFLMQSRINKGPLARAANPIEQISKLLRDVVGNVRTMLVVMTALIIIVSGVGIFVSIYNSMSDRKREIAIMRALGARRGTVFSIIIAEAVLLCAGGGVLGLLIGHALVFIAAPIVEARSDMLIDPWAFEAQELIIFPALLVLAVVVGIFPGLTAYRTDVAKGLSD
ncbi:MAG: ABC transporter permease [Planctomycetaceae bacterium]|nr:ABC transporter permease [Planctomycetaceae bacterium]